MVKDAKYTANKSSKSFLSDPESIEKVFQENEFLCNENSKLKISLEEAREKIHWFEEQIKLGRQRHFGKSSETLSSIQGELIFNAQETLNLGSQEKEKNVSSESQTITDPRKTKGRKLDTSKLPRKQVFHDLPADEKKCSTCAGDLHKIREDVSEQIEIIPKQVYVVEHIHPQYGCRHCETVQSAEKEPSPIPKSMAGASLIGDVIISKYEHHLPLYRQSKILAGLNIDIPDNTLGKWVMQSGEALRPMDEALEAEILAASYLQVDETPVKLLEPEKKAFMWCYLSPLSGHRLIRFRFDLSRSGEVVKSDLKDFKGLLQNDGYSGYNGMREKSEVVPFGCMAHSRRKFAEIAKISKTVGKAHEALKYFAALYRIENQAREQKLIFEERKKLRQKESAPILEKFQDWLVKSKNQVPPQSTIGAAIQYALNQWCYLIQYVHHGEVEIDNNWVENEIRPFALGRRNWLFLAHEESAQIAALFYSLIQSARLNNLNSRIYMHYLLTQVHALRKKEINARDLLPHRIDRNQLQQFADNEFQKAKALFSTFVTQK